LSYTVDLSPSVLFYLQFTTEIEPARSVFIKLSLLHSRVDTMVYPSMAHLKRVARTGFPLSDGHAVPGTLADHACTWTENPRPKRRTRSLPHTGTAVPAVPLACNGASAKLQLASGHNFLVSNSTERSSRPSPRAAPPRGVHKDAHQPIKSRPRLVQ
jgi:hypothetical protein